MDNAASFDRALALHRQGSLDDAALEYERVLSERPADFDATYHLSLLRSTQGRLDEALLLATASLETRPGSAKAQAHLGGLLSALGRPREALPYLEQANTLDPALPDARNNYGAVLRALKRNEEARRQFAKALELAPAYPNARFNLAGTLAVLERYDEALPHYEALLATQPDSYEMRTSYAKALWKCDRLDEAMLQFERVIAQKSDFSEARAHYANALAEAGRLDDARDSLDRAIALDPRRPEYYRFLTDVAPGAILPEQIAFLEATAGSAEASDDDVVEANFCLAKLYGDRGDRARSFAHLLAANARRRRSIDYDEAGTLMSFDRIAAVLTSEYLGARRGCGDPSTQPVFILGMPRSGTTLIEQILASHPDVHGAGELTLFEETLDDLIGGGNRVSEATMLGATCDALRSAGERYASKLRERAPAGVARITDKMPGNFRFAGLINVVLPNARIIHAKRDPADTCLSCFEQYFGGDQPFAYDLAELGRYYRGYLRLMAHWRSVLPPQALLEVQYEDVVGDLETQARRIVAFCGLPWDERCLEFYRLKRPVRTASVAQVRRPIYRTSVNKSREYGDLLEALTGALADPT